MSGCAKKPAPTAGSKPKKEAKLPFEAVQIGPGDTVVQQSADPKAPPSFTLHWEGGEFDLDKGGLDEANLKAPRGEIFGDGKTVATYRADAGGAARETRRLQVRGDVVFRSQDETQTLKAPRGEYRNDERLVRMTGGVVASGTFGTLSGVPELWATPDLRLIGTPDMVAKTLKTPALLALAATATMGSPRLQKGNDYTFKNAGSVSGERLKAGGYRITARPKAGGPIVILIPSRGLVIRSAGEIVVLTDPKGSDVRRAVSQGKVEVEQTAAAGTTTMEGDGATYATSGGETATLDIGGPVTISSAAKGKDGVQTTVSRGQKGQAVLLNRPGAERIALKSATLSGNVTIDSKGAQGDTFRGTGARLVYTPQGATSDVALTGGVVLISVTRGKDDAGKAVTNTVLSRGARADATLDPTAAVGANPLKTATLVGGVAIDVSGSNGQTFKGTGNRVVYTAVGDGGKAIMTGDLKFSGDAPSFLGSIEGADIATVLIGPDGWERVDLDNSENKPTKTTIQTRPGKKGGGR